MKNPLSILKSKKSEPVSIIPAKIEPEKPRRKKRKWDFPNTPESLNGTRYKLTTHGYKPTQEGLTALFGKDIKWAHIHIEEFFYDDGAGAAFYIGDYQIGTAFQKYAEDSTDGLYELLDRGQINTMYVEIVPRLDEYTTNVFVK